MADAPDIEEDGEPNADQRAFRTNLLIVGGAHCLVLVAFFAISKLQPKPVQPQLVWLDSGALAAAQSAAMTPVSAGIDEETLDEETPVAEPEVEPVPEPVPPREAPPAPSEIVLPAATPEPTPVRVTPKPATPKPKRVTPKRATPKPKRATPKTDSRIAKKEATPKKTEEKTAAKASPSPAESALPTPAEKKVAQNTKAGSAGTKDGGSKGTGTGKSGAGSGGGNDEFGWYYQMLDDRFTSRWQQPLTIVRSTQQFVTTLKIRIAKDGTILSREIANPSGNPVMDESVMNGAQKVLVVDPLPAGLGGESFDVNINFTLDQGL